MAKSKSMLEAEERLRVERGEPNLDLLQEILRKVNEDDANLNEVAAEYGVARATMENWLMVAGYRYEVKRRFVPVTVEAVNA